MRAIDKPAPRLHRIPAPSAPRAVIQTPKHEYVRDEGYRHFVAGHACFRCGRAGASQAAHSNSDQHGKGLSIKASDAALFPLCVTDLGGIGCHEMHDQAKDGLTKQQRRDQEIEWIALMKEIAAREGYQISKRREQ